MIRSSWRRATLSSAAVLGALPDHAGIRRPGTKRSPSVSAFGTAYSRTRNPGSHSLAGGTAALGEVPTTFVSLAVLLSSDARLARVCDRSGPSSWGLRGCASQMLPRALLTLAQEVPVGVIVALVHFLAQLRDGDVVNGGRYVVLAVRSRYAFIGRSHGRRYWTAPLPCACPFTR